MSIHNNNNTVSQTLFRFVSLRNPQLTETSNENLGFIFRPENNGRFQGYFDMAIANWNPSQRISKIKALENAAANFSELEDLSTEKEIDAGRFRKLRKLGNNLSQKKFVVAETLFDEAKSEWNTLIDEGGFQAEALLYKELWDHYIFQVITQKNFYVKEALSQILKAIHAVYINSLILPTEYGRGVTINYLDIVANAVIVLPEKLFNDSVSTGNGIISPEITQKTISIAQINKLEEVLEKEIEISKALISKTELLSLVKELKKVESNYLEEYETAYKEAYGSYSTTIQPLITTYENSIALVEAGFTEQTTEAEKTIAYEVVAPLNLPAFEFKNEEITGAELQTRLSEKALNTLVDFIFLEENIAIHDSEIQNPELPLFSLPDDFNTFRKILDKAADEISDLSSLVLSLSEIPFQKYTNVGGVLMPVRENHLMPPFAYYFQPYSDLFSRNKQSFLQFGFFVEDESWTVASANLNATTDKGRFTEKINNLKVSSGKISFPAMLLNKFQTITSLEIEIWFENGSHSKLEFSNPDVNIHSTGLMKIGVSDTFGGTTGTTETFQPKHFGVKRLGIADYLKVEQSVHAYVPGEVSNIENVMASELRHKSSTSREYSEITDSTSKSQETEKMSDTTKTSRTDMQTEVARELDKQQSYEAHTRFGKSGTWYFEMGGSYANNTAQHDSNRQAVAKSQEITERALERVLSKISEERVEKIIKEYTETNVHEFDNRGKITNTTNPGEAKPQHITGVYRWVDKKMKNQIYNYGKRTMFEFMIPEPARLHVLATKAGKASFAEPVDPRTAPVPNTMKDANTATEELLKYWANVYGITLTNMLDRNILHSAGVEVNLDNSASPRFFNFSIPDNYKAYEAEITYAFYNRFKKNSAWLTFDNLKGGTVSFEGWARESWNRGVYTAKDLNIVGTYDMIYYGGNGTTNVALALQTKCTLSDSYILSWKQENFNKIIATYDEAYKKFKEQQAAADAEAAGQEKANQEKKANFYRITEANIIKHNCIAYLLQSYGALGQTTSSDDGQKIQSFKMLFGDNLDNYTALAKFMEQAFEWEVMDYTFYPYYWASKAHWQDLYLSEDMDPLFRSFLQAGMARVIVTVKPGFENAVQFFMTTGRIWNGGDVPVIGDPLYLSIVDELRQPTGEPQGKFWITRIPTTLTILQDKSTGLSVTQPLPIFPENDPDNCENPAELETETSFTQREYHLADGKDTTTLPKEITNVYNEKIIVQ